MGKKHYPQILRDEAVIFYERGHTFAETRAKYGMAESTFFEWKKKFDKRHPLPDATAGRGNAARKARLHLEKLALEWEVLRQCPCGIDAPVDAKIGAINALTSILSMCYVRHWRFLAVHIITENGGRGKRHPMKSMTPSSSH